MKYITNIALFLMAVATLFSALNVSRTMKEVEELNNRIDHLYTERGFNELKCKAAGGEYFNQYIAVLDQDGQVISRTKKGCFRTNVSKDEVEIKL